VRTTVNIREPLLVEARRLAAQRGVTLSDVVEDALRIHLADPAPKKQSPVQAHVVTSEIVDPLLNLDRTSDLMAREDEEAFALLVR